MVDIIAEYLTLINHINTGDKMWVYEYDFETVQQSSEWLEVPKKCMEI